MSIGSGLALYFIIWWLVFFAVLPFGVRTQEEAGEVTAGTTPSAPVRPLLRRKVIWTTALAALVFAGVLAVRATGLTWGDLPFLPDFAREGFRAAEPPRQAP